MKSLKDYIKEEIGCDNITPSNTMGMGNPGCDNNGNCTEPLIKKKNKKKRT